MSSPEPSGDVSADDVTLVDNEISRCLDEAGRRLHVGDMPERMWKRLAATGETDYWAGVMSSVTTTGQDPVEDLTHRQARFFLDRVAFLDRLGTRRAAAYLRKELLDAISAQRADGDSATLAALGFERPKSMKIGVPTAVVPAHPAQSTLPADWLLKLENTFLRQWKARFDDI